MPQLKPETMEKLATTLSSDTELYNELLTHMTESDAAIEQERQKQQELNEKLAKTEQLNGQYLGQISNLLTKIPVGSAEKPESYEQMRESIKDRSW